ncbi:MAG: hypothetical protein JSV95_11570 [Gemmatimonadota bacterium]|nr:MAG: hypothetical protein JSV95_11570 [Gemmatimonadota bacterium]
MRRQLWMALCSLAFAGCATGSSPDRPDPTMTSHFDAAAGVHTAVILGDLDGVRTPAGWLAEHAPPDLPEGSEAFVAELQKYAARAADARNLEDAAYATGRIAQACGECHQAYVRGPVPVLPPGAASGDDVAAHMVGHAWAVRRMWEGLVVPADESWMAGARALECQRLPPEAVAADDLEAADYLEKRCHGLGSRAQLVSGASARARIYGELIATCADCHQRLGRKIAVVW